MQFLNRKLLALSLIETVIFIAIVGFISSFLLQNLRSSFNTLPTSEMNQKAIILAQSRMETLLGQISIQGFSNFHDFCQNPTPPNICLTDPNLQIETNIISFPSDPRFKQITINVSGLGSATLTTLLTPVAEPLQSAPHTTTQALTP